MIVRKTIAFFIIACSLNAYGQNDSLSFEERFALLEAEMDSLSIFYLIDSVLQLALERKSEINPRLSYNSNVLSAGRNYGIDQHGISPGLAFYHKSGLFADYTGFWNNNFEPEYNLSIFSAGYLGSLGKHWSYTPSYERWVYHTGDTEETSTGNLNNSLGSTFTYRAKPGYATVDYSYLFGEDNSAHRLIGSLSGSIGLGKWWIFKSVTILPSFTTFFGNQKVVIRFDGDVYKEIRTNEYIRQNIESGKLRAFLSGEEIQEIERIRRNQSLAFRQKLIQITNIYLSNEEAADFIYDELDEEEDHYGLMSYSFSLPILLTTKKWSFYLSYTYSIPIQLPGETIKPEPIGYLGASVSYRISLGD